MNCYFHPSDGAVAQCVKCGKSICKNCVDRYSKSGDKYAGRCRDCVLEAGVECSCHPPKQAHKYCEKCGDPICRDCCLMFKFCYKCTNNSLNNEIAECKDLVKLEKGKRAWVFIFSAIGLFLGVFCASDYLHSNPNETEIGIFLIWLCLGIGGNFWAALGNCFEFYNIGNEKGESFWSALRYAFFLAIFLLLLKSLAGPIIPIIKILEYTKNMKTAKSNAADFAKLLGKMADYYEYAQYMEKHGADADLAKLTKQGGELFNNAYAQIVLQKGEKEAQLGFMSNEYE